MSYLYLFIAIIVEVIATSSLKASEEFTKLVPSMLVIIGYGTAIYLLMLAVRTIPVGIAYAIWSGLGIFLVALVGSIVFREIPDMPAVIGMILIVAGVLVINLFSKSV